MFSQIAAQFHGETNFLYRLRDDLNRQGQAVRDLVSGNINDHSIFFPQDFLEEILIHGSRSCQVYRPDSLGQRAARDAVSSYYRRYGIDIDPGCILLTPGTSVAYWYCFKLLADEGDEILCPRPSYPLFDYVALMSGVKLIPYNLEEEHNWAINLEYLEANVSNRTRALVLISPHNPTGHVSTPEEIDGLAEIALRHDLAIISDEVFSEFLFKEVSLPRPAGSAAPLVITLNGFSKMFALPGIKFGWMAISGEPEKVKHAMRALEFISDTFLPVNEIIQASAPMIFQRGQVFLAEYAQQIRQRWKVAEELLASCRRFSYLRPDGGFYVPLHLKGLDEEQAAQAILRNHHLLVHPGYFYDMEPHHLVLSFIQEPNVIRDSFAELIKILESLPQS